MTGPDTHPEHYGHDRCLAVTLAAERFLRDLSRDPADVLDGLADRPAKGRKARARVAYREMLSQMHELRKVVRSTRPVGIVGSDGGLDGEGEAR